MGDYREKIIRMVNNIDDWEILRAIYTYTKYLSN